MDGWYPKVRIGQRRVRVPVLVTLGVRADGQRVVLDVRLAGDESTAAWRDVIRSLAERHVGRPLLAIIDGSAGLAAALREQWPTLAIQRCTGQRRVRVPVLVTLGVRADGQRVVLDVRLAGDESTAAWRDVIRSLAERHVGRPLLAIIDGSAGLAAALREQWPTLAIQRCTA